MTGRPRTRLWASYDSSTAVQFRNDLDVKVWLHTNMGWVPIGNAPKDDAGAEAFAEGTAAGYDLVECDEEQARYMAGMEEDSSNDASLDYEPEDAHDPANPWRES